MAALGVDPNILMMGAGAGRRRGGLAGHGLGMHPFLAGGGLGMVPPMLAGAGRGMMPPAMGLGMGMGGGLGGNFGGARRLAHGVAIGHLGGLAGGLGAGVGGGLQGMGGIGGIAMSPLAMGGGGFGMGGGMNPLVMGLGRALPLELWMEQMGLEDWDDEDEVDDPDEAWLINLIRKRRRKDRMRFRSFGW
ncbi:hypothetical protein Tdes44962_MAKER04287 [Teratosphaeria destructans]|uniref:Uncharacterized protein n=1 Tax=Teratosphaeria destructans TaxID=418781 RepID=A0A9W7SMR7_9PEZI|nr:hypothetical protein Tdes44962_MAKER04287 [Teratosphaeria destructans]